VISYLSIIYVLMLTAKTRQNKYNSMVDQGHTKRQLLVVLDFWCNILHDKNYC